MESGFGDAARGGGGEELGRSGISRRTGSSRRGAGEVCETQADADAAWNSRIGAGEICETQADVHAARVSWEMMRGDRPFGAGRSRRIGQGGVSNYTSSRVTIHLKDV